MPEGNKSIKKNMMMNVILTTSNFVFPLITYAYVARVLLPVGTGKVSFVQSVMAYFGYIASLGVGAYGMREAARQRDHKEQLSKLVQELMVINLLSTLVAYVTMFIAIGIIPKFRDYTALFIVMSIQYLLQTLGCEWFYQGMEEYGYITKRSLLFKCISVALTFLLIRSPEDVVIYGFLTVFTTSASGVLNFFNLRKYITFKKVGHYELKKHMKPILVLFVSSMVITIYGHFDSLMLGFMNGDYTVGIYGAALKIKSIVLSVSTAITSVLIPRMSLYFAKRDMGKIQNMLTKSMRVTCCLMLPLSIFIILNPSNILSFVCGDVYLPAKNTLIILMLCCVVLSITNLFGNQILLPRRDEKRYATSVFIGMWVNLILNFLLIPMWGSAGAAFATLITETFNALWMGWGCREEMKSVMAALKLRLYIFPLATASLFEFFIQRILPDVPVFWELVINTLVFFGAYYLLLLAVKEPLLKSVIDTVKKKLENKKYYTGNKTGGQTS